MANTLRISYQANPDTLPGKTWAVVEQIPFKPEVPSLEDAATLLDAAFNYNPCTGETEPALDEEGQLDPVLTESEFFQLAGEIAPAGVCIYEEGYTAHIKVYLSDNDKTFDFNVDGQGEVTQVSEHKSSVSYTLELEEASSVPLEYPVYYDPANTNPLYDPFKVIDEAGNEVSATANIDSISFSSPMSGTFTVTHDVYIYLHYVLVPCNPLDDPLPAPRIIVFYDLLAYDTTVDAPEIDTSNIPEDAQYISCQGGSYGGGSQAHFDGVSNMCVKEVRHWGRCRCSEERTNVHYQEEHILCDNWGDTPSEVFDGYVDCQEREALYSRDFYLETCCTPFVPTPERNDLPYCEESTSIFYGGVPFEDQERWEANHGVGNVIFIPISPKGEPCGEHRVEWTIDDQDCCGPGTPTLQWTQTYDELFKDPGSYIFCISGGVAPFTWEAVGTEGISIVGTDAEQPDGSRCRRVVISLCFCEPATIKVTDACGTVIVHGVTMGDGLWTKILGDKYATASNDPEWEFNAFQVVPYGSAHQRPRTMFDPASIGAQWLGQTVAYQNYRLLSGAIQGKYAITQGPFIAPSDPYQWSFSTLNTWGWAGCTPVGVGDLDLPDPEFGIFTVPVAGSPSAQERAHDTFCPSLPDIFYKYFFNYTGLQYWEWKCPDSPEDLVYDDENSADVVSDGNWAYIRVEGGTGPYTFEVDGQGFYLDQAHTLIEYVTSSLFTKVYATDACGVCNITVTDNCGFIVTGVINSDQGVWDSTCNYIKSWIISGPQASWGGQPYVRNATTCGAGSFGGQSGCPDPGSYLQTTNHYTWHSTGEFWESRTIHAGTVCVYAYEDMINDTSNAPIYGLTDPQPDVPNESHSCENYPCTWHC